MRLLNCLCDDTVERMRGVLHRIWRESPGLGLIVPETLHGGLFYDLFKEYTIEQYSAPHQSVASNGSEDSVCFIVPVVGESSLKESTLLECKCVRVVIVGIFIFDYDMVHRYLHMINDI